MFNKSNKSNLILFAVSAVLVALYMFPFSSGFHASGYYVTVDSGMSSYANNFFALDGRLVGYLYLHLMDLLNLPISFYIISMKLLALLFASLSIIILYNTFASLLTSCDFASKDKTKPLITYILCTSIILNPGSNEFFYFPESGIMVLSILLITIAIYLYANCSSSNKYLYIFALLFFSTICYQSAILIYMPLCLSIVFLKTSSTMPIKEKQYKAIVIEIIKNIAIVAGALLLNLLLVYYLKSFFIPTVKLYNSISPSKENILLMIFKLLFLWQEWIPIFVYTFIYYVMIIAIIIQKPNFIKSKWLLFAFILMIISGTIFEVVSILYLTSTYFAFRLAYAYFAILPLLITIIINSVKTDSKNINFGFCIIATVILLINYFQSFETNHYGQLTAKEDYIEVQRIVKTIENHKQQGNPIAKLVFSRSPKYSNFTHKDVFNSGNKTLRKIGGLRCAKEYLSYYLEKDLLIEYDSSIHSKIFNNKDFDESQILVKDDVLYYLLY